MSADLSGRPESADDGSAGGDPGQAGANRRFRVSVSAPSVVQQARLMDSAGTAWHAVKYGNLEVRTARRWPLSEAARRSARIRGSLDNPK